MEYSWGDFKHDAKQVLAQYFDAFLYMANWGSRELLFRLPKALIDPKQIEPYCLDYSVALEPVGDYFVLTISLGEQEPTGEWLEGGDWLSALTPLRNDILLGDNRALYLAWLANVESAELVDELEPPLPAGLSKLTTPLNRLASFLEIDPHLLKAAAATSAEPSSVPDAVLRNAIARMTRDECDDFLWRLAQGEPRLSADVPAPASGAHWRANSGRPAPAHIGRSADGSRSPGQGRTAAKTASGRSEAQARNGGSGRP